MQDATRGVSLCLTPSTQHDKTNTGKTTQEESYPSTPFPPFENTTEFVEAWLQRLETNRNPEDEEKDEKEDIHIRNDPLLHQTEDAELADFIDSLFEEPAPRQQHTVEKHPFDDDEFGGFWNNSEEDFGVVEEALENILLEVPEETMAQEEAAPNDDFIHLLLLHSETSSVRVNAEKKAWEDLERTSLSDFEGDDEDDPTDGFDNDSEDGFDYTDPQIAATPRELQALAFYRIALKYGAQHEMIDDFREFIYDFYDRYTKTKKIPTLPTYRSLLEKVTGLVPTYYDACKFSCVCFVDKYKDRSECPTYGHPRINKRMGRAYSRFMVIPLEKRIRL